VKADVFWPFQDRKILLDMRGGAAHRRGLIGMKRSKRTTGWPAAILVGVGAGAAAVYLYSQGLIPPLPTVQGTGTDNAPVASSAPARPKASAPAEAPSQPQIAATGEVAPPAKPMTVPSFDVVLVEPNGEGVLAGRAQPGWTVTLESGGTKVAMATADAQGEWSIVLEKPLPQGNHSLSLKTISPDGTRALSSQQTVSVAVAKVGEDTAAPLAGASESANGPAGNVPIPSDTVAADAAQSKMQVASIEPTIQATVGGGQATQQPRPGITLSTVDYQDTGSEAGKLTVTGTADPGAQLSLYFDDVPVAKVTADGLGMWRIETDKKLGLGAHTFRAERYDQAAQKVAARAMVTFERANPAPPPAVAETGKSQVAAAEAGQQQTSAQDALTNEKAKIYVIKRGDTLWDIARRYLGSGFLYSSIFQDNREVIRNPDLILPQQQVKMPKP
jgi:nucleoid-associated protein YgaU